MIISGILDSRGVQEGLSVIVEFFTTEDIPDLSAYGIGISETNVGYRESGIQFRFPMEAIQRNKYIYFVHVHATLDSTRYLSTFLGKTDLKYYYSQKTIFRTNGQQAYLLYRGASIVDIFGELGVSGNSRLWYYYLGWCYRKSSALAPRTQWSYRDWTTSGGNGITDWTRNSNNAKPFPSETIGLGE